MYLFDRSANTALLRQSFHLVAANGDVTETSYTASEKDSLNAEAERLYNKLSHSIARNKKTRLLHIGADAQNPRMKKILSTLAQSWADTYKPYDNGFIHLDRTETILNNMRPYQEDLANTKDPEYSQKKWAAGSTYITRLIANQACLDGLNIILGDAGEDDGVDHAYKIARNIHREISTSVIVTSDTNPDEFRKLIDASDRIDLYCSVGDDPDTVLAASLQQDTLAVYNETAMNALTNYLLQQKVSLASYDLIKSPQP